MKDYHKHNFHKHTYCEWKSVSLDEIQGSQISFKSKSGSQYFFTDKGVFRKSNHWGRIGNCRWILKEIIQYKNQEIKIGYAHWSDFHSNNDWEKLFFIQVDFQEKKVSYSHKDSTTNNKEYVLRNAKETAKRISLINDIMINELWSKHLKYDNIDAIRLEIINQLIFTEKSFLEIKRDFL